MMIPQIPEDELYQGYLTKVYQHTQGYQQYSTVEQAQFAKDKICVTYGELLYPSVQKLIKRLVVEPDACFLDLGSGLGKCALQVFMQTAIKKVIGIEASGAVCKQSLSVVEQVKSELPFLWEERRSLSFICDNFLEHDWQEATIVYSCSTCFTEALLIAIGDRINSEPSVQQVFSLRPISSLTRLPLQAVFGVECSWDSALCFYYGTKSI